MNAHDTYDFLVVDLPRGGESNLVLGVFSVLSSRKELGRSRRLQVCKLQQRRTTGTVLIQSLESAGVGLVCKTFVLSCIGFGA